MPGPWPDIDVHQCPAWPPTVNGRAGRIMREDFERRRIRHTCSSSGRVGLALCRCTPNSFRSSCSGHPQLLLMALQLPFVLKSHARPLSLGTNIIAKNLISSKGIRYGRRCCHPSPSKTAWSASPADRRGRFSEANDAEREGVDAGRSREADRRPSGWRLGIDWAGIAR